MRYPSIDVLRTVAIILMVVVHFLENLSGATWAPAGFGAPLFAFLVGVNFRIWLRSQETKGIAPATLSRRGARRGLFLFALGIVFNVFVWLPTDTFNWDVLTMIGTAILAITAARNCPTGLIVFLCGMIFLLAPFLRIQADYNSYWLNGYFESDTTLPDVLIGYLATGYFPLFPWLIFPLSGYVVGCRIFPDRSEPSPSVAPVVWLGLGSIALSAVFIRIRTELPEPVPSALVKGWTMFPASVEYVTGTLGMALTAFALLHVFVDRRKGFDKFPWLLTITGTMGRYSLSIYLLHHILHLWPLWLYGALFGTEATEYWRTAMPAEISLPLAGVALVGCYGLFREIRRREWPTVESVMRWICD